MSDENQNNDDDYDFDIAAFNKLTSKQIKSEPVFDDYPSLEVADDVDFSTGILTPVQPSSRFQQTSAASAILDPPPRPPSIRVKSIYNEENFFAGNQAAKAPTPSNIPLSRLNRDPRLRNTNETSETYKAARRRAFIEGKLSADDLVKEPASARSEYQPKIIKSIKEKCEAAHRLMDRQTPAFFYANFPLAEVIPSGQRENRSPLVAGSNVAQFVSLSSVDCARDALESQRYRNIPLDVQEQGVRIGVDLDSISQRLTAVGSETPAPVVNDKIRSIAVQTETGYGGKENKRQRVEQEDKSIQTTKNTGYFSFTCDVAELTREQRAILDKFKKDMGIRDETLTKSTLERIQHRKVNRIDARNQNRDFAGPSSQTFARDGPTSSYMNPPAPNIWG